jgi:hypothetical protein
MDTELKPCPFCGGPGVLELEECHFPSRRKPKYYAVKCETSGCPASNIAQDGEMGGFFNSWPKDEAIAVWNKRA